MADRPVQEPSTLNFYHPAKSAFDRSRPLDALICRSRSVQV